jgi:hypothetical protein
MRPGYKWEGSEKVILNRTEQSDVYSLAQPPEDAPEMKRQLIRAAEALAELYGLLEEYAPSWYTQQHHQRAESALRQLRGD